MTAPGRWRRPFARVREYLAMRHLLDLAGEDAPRRALAFEAASEARQKRDAAEALLLRGSRAEALRLGVASLERLREALALTGSAPTKGLQRAAERVERFGAALGTPPDLDAAVTWEQMASLRGLIGAEIVLDRRLAVEVLDRRGLLRLRRQRRVLAAMILSTPLLVAAFAYHALYGIHVRASSVLDDEYAADRAVDGDPDTEWVAGSGDEWLELRFPARRVETLRILNGDTLPDRAARQISVEFYLHGESHPVTAREFETQYPAQWMDFDGAGMLCDRIRIVILTHYGVGGAIAEVEVH